MSPKPFKIVSKIVRDEPVSIESRFQELERDTEHRLIQLEESLEVFKDVVLKLHEEREKIRKENMWLKQKLKKVADPIARESQEIMDLARADWSKPLEPNGTSPASRETKPNIGKGAEATKSSVVWSKRKDPRLKTVRWLRTRFGLSPTPGKKMLPANKNN